MQPVEQLARLDGPHRFGLAIAIDGQTAVIGAPGTFVGGGMGPPVAGPGWVYMYANAGDSWVQQASFEDPGVANGTGGAQQYFGAAVAVSGDRAVVAATGRGAVYVYARSGDKWMLETTLPSIGSLGQSVGLAPDQTVAIQGDTILVGGTNAAYVFARTGSTWTQQAKLTAPDGGPSDNFGSAVALSNGTALIAGFNKNHFTGAAYVFVQNGSQWDFQGELTAADGKEIDYFGNSVALDGDTALIGAFNRNTYRGGAYVFTRTAGMWTQKALLTASDEAPGDYFGISVALRGSTAVVDGQIDTLGAAYVFERIGSTWVQQAELTGATPGHLYAQRVALSGSTMLASADLSDGQQTSVYVYRIPAGPRALNAASLAQAPIAPGEEVALITNLGPDAGVTATADVAGLLPTQLGGVQVFFDGVAVPIFYAQKQQVNVQAPYELNGANANIRIVYNNQATWTSTIPVQSAAPAIYHADGGAGSPQALVLNQDSTLNSDTNPAPRGSVVALWATGGGVVAPAAVTGGFTPSDSPAPLAQAVSISVGGAPAQVIYQGLAPTLPTAVFQVSFEIPADAPAGPKVRLTISVGAAVGSDPPAGTTLAVR